MKVIPRALANRNRPLAALPLLLLLCLAAASYGQDAPEPREVKINSGHDRDTNRTFVSFGPVPLTRATPYQPGYVAFGALFSYPEKTPARPAHVALVFVRASQLIDSCANSKRCDVGVSAGGRSLDLGAPQTTRSGVNRGPVAVEQLTVTLPPETFAEVAAAGEVKLTLGGQSFQLNRALLKALRDLSGRVPK